MESAHKLGIQTWLVSKIQLWIEQFKKRYGPLEQTQHHGRRHHSTSAQAQELTQEKELKGPYIKFEVTNHEFRPVFSEFRRFPKIFFGGRAGQSPFFQPENNPAGGGVKTVNRLDPVAAAKAKQAQEAAKQYRKAAKAVQPQNGYCEICDCPFSELEEHLRSKVHKAKVGLDELWSKLDSCISDVNRGTSDEDSDFEEVRVATSDQ